MDTVGDRLDKVMREAGIKSQSALSAKSGVPQPTIARILKGQGKSEPETATIKKLAAACGVSFNWLNEGVESGPGSILTAKQREWLDLLNYLGTDDIKEFEVLIRQRQVRNKRLLQEFKDQ
jgi:transcriptional regulator with XRE-family HTH domain